MSIPKIKVYKLEQTYNPSNDTDVQSISKDEIYPIIEKPIDPSNAKELVGVSYNDNQIIAPDYIKTEIGESVTYDILWYNKIFDMAIINEQQSLTKTESIICDGWRLTHTAFKVYVYRKKTNESFGEWVLLPSNFYRFVTTNQKTMFDSYNEITLNSDNVYSIRNVSYIYFELGQQLFDDISLVWDSAGYSTYDPITQIKVEYQVYKELNGTNFEILNSLNQETSVAYIQSGNIYNGNKVGNTGNYKEGNYNFLKKILPLRYLVAQQKDYETIDVIKNIEIEDGTNGSVNGRFTINNCDNWILDGDFKARLFERVYYNLSFDESDSSSTSSSSSNSEDSTRFFMRELEPSSQYTMTINRGTNSVDVVFKFNDDYYLKSAGNYVFPKEVFVRYNETDDFLENIFDFDYDYTLIPTPSNTGNLIASNLNIPSSNYLKVNKKKNILAVQTLYGFNSLHNIEIQTATENDKVVGSISLGIDYYWDLYNPIKVYHNGSLIYNSLYEESGYESEKAELQNDSNLQFEVSFENKSIVFSRVNEELTEFPKDLMIVYYNSYDIGFGKKDESSNYSVWGYRICCYEKTKDAKIFVSSFPNWVTNHLNNNPDVFMGYKKYDGTSTSGTNGIYPNYITTGYSIIYRDGYVEFESTITQLDEDDVRNFLSTVVDLSEVTDIRPYLMLVLANFAYYEGLYNVTRGEMILCSMQGGKYAYKLVDDVFYKEISEKKWVLRNDSNFPCLFESGANYLPDIKTASNNIATAFATQPISSGKYYKVNTNTKRLFGIKFLYGTAVEKYFILLINKSYLGNSEIVTSKNEDDVEIRIRMNDGVLEILDPNSSIWIQLNQMNTSYNLSFQNFVDLIPKYVFSNETWSYDVVVELLSYRSNFVELLIYSKDK